MPKISCIITTYKRPEKIRRAIESVRNQTFTDLEIIVVNDELDMTDLSILRDEYLLTDPRIQIFGHEHTGKHAIIKNFGIKQSKGEYLAFLDDDNSWRPDHLQALYNALDRDKTLDLSYGDRWLHDEDGHFPDQIGIFNDYNPKALLERNYIDTSDFLVKREAIIDIGGWDERYKRMADWNLVIRLAKNGAKMARVPLIITDYTLSTDSISHTPENKKQEIGFNPYELEVDLPYLHKVKEIKVAVFTVMHKDEDLPIAQKCIPEMHKRMGYPVEEHVFVMNGELPNTVEWIKKYAKDNNIELEVQDG